MTAPARLGTVTDAEAPDVADERDLETEAAGQDAGRKLRAAIDRLPEKYRLPLLYTAIDGLDYDAVARLLAVPVGTVKTNVFRAKALLRERLESAP